jgi:DNA-directed RNA polymerase specialized sigma24 family protein
MTFEEFAQAQLPAGLTFATVLTGQRATAEDLAQEVLIRACTRWDKIGGLDRPESYVRKMVLNEFLSWRRRTWRLIPAGDAELSASSGQRAEPRPLQNGGSTAPAAS